MKTKLSSSRFVRVAKNSTLLLFSVAICLVICEYTLRFLYGYGHLDKPYHFHKFHEHDPEIGVVLSPGREGMLRTFEGDRFYYVKTNSYGFRGKKIRDRKTPKVAILGDSFIFGYGVDQKHLFSTVLDSLSAREIVNMGVPGTSVDQMYLLLKRYIDSIYFSDVILYISPNDFADLMKTKRMRVESPYLIKAGDAYKFIFPENKWPYGCSYSASSDEIVCDSLPFVKRIKTYLSRFMLVRTLYFKRVPARIKGEQKSSLDFALNYTYEDFKEPAEFEQDSPSHDTNCAQWLKPEKISRMHWILGEFNKLAEEYEFNFHIVYDRLDIDNKESAYLEHCYCVRHDCISFDYYRRLFTQKNPEVNIICPRNPHWNEIGHRLFAYVLYDRILCNKSNES
jgi:hypothetical protein